MCIGMGAMAFSPAGKRYRVAESMHEGMQGGRASDDGVHNACRIEDSPLGASRPQLSQTRGCLRSDGEQPGQRYRVTRVVLQAVYFQRAPPSPDRKH